MNELMITLAVTTRIYPPYLSLGSLSFPGTLGASRASILKEAKVAQYLTLSCWIIAIEKKHDYFDSTNNIDLE